LNGCSWDLIDLFSLNIGFFWLNNIPFYFSNLTVSCVERHFNFQIGNINLSSPKCGTKVDLVLLNLFMILNIAFSSLCILVPDTTQRSILWYMLFFVLNHKLPILYSSFTYPQVVHEIFLKLSWFDKACSAG